MLGILKKVPLFSELNNDELEAVRGIVTTYEVSKKNIVVQEGEPGDAMYIILDGSVKISYYTADGQEVVLSILSNGSFFGEMALLDSQPRSATVTTMENTRLGQIRRRDMEHLLMAKPAITLKLLSEVVSRLRRTSQVLERISTMDVPHRLYDFLCDFCRRNGTETPDGDVIAKLPTHQLLADQLSTSRETISRAISALKKEGIIAPSEMHGMVKVDIDALETLLEAFHDGD